MPEIDDSDQETFFLLKYMLQDKNTNNIGSDNVSSRSDHNFDSFHLNQNSADGSVSNDFFFIFIFISIFTFTFTFIFIFIFIFTFIFISYLNFQTCCCLFSFIFPLYILMNFLYFVFLFFSSFLFYIFHYSLFFI